jgi:hypothetical protein
MVALKGDKEIGDKINKIIARLAEANDLKGVIDVADFNDPDKLGRARRWWTACPTWWASSRTPAWISARTAPKATTCWATPTST